MTSAPVVEQATASPSESTAELHPSALVELRDSPELMTMPYDKRLEWVNNAGQAVHNYLKNNPDGNDENTSAAFAGAMGALYQKIAPPKPQGVLESFTTPITEDIIPNAAGTVAGIGAGIGTALTPAAPLAPVADVAAATATTYGMTKARDALRGKEATQRAMEQREANRVNKWSSGAGELVTSIPTMLNPTSWFTKGAAKTVPRRLADMSSAGMRMGGIQAGKTAAQGHGGAADALQTIVREGIVTAPLGFFGPAKTLLTALLVKAPKEAVTMAAANEMWSAAAEHRAPDLSKWAGDLGANIPAFLLFNAVGHGMHKSASETSPDRASDMGAAGKGDTVPGDAASVPPPAGGSSPPTGSAPNAAKMDGAPSGTPSRDAYNGRPSDGTTIAHADTDARAVAAGFEIPERGTRWTEAGARAEAAERMKDPTYASRLVQFYTENPDVRIDPVNAVVLGEHLARLSESFDALRNRLRLMRADAPERSAAVTELQTTEEALKAALTVTTKAGSAWGSEGRARQIQRGKEQLESLPQTIFTLEAKTGKPLTKPQREKVEKAFDDEKAKADKLAALEKAKAERAEQAAVKKGLAAAIAESAKQKRAGGKKVAFESFVDKQMAAAKARLRGAGKTMATLDPFGLVDHAIIGAGYIAKGVVKLAEWSARMIADLGESIRPHLDAIYAAAKAQAEAWKTEFAKGLTPEAILAKAPAGQPIPDGVVKALVRHHVEAGETTPQGLLAKVHADLLTVRPEQTTKETAVAISGYGKVSIPDAAPLRKLERELKTLVRLQTALAEAESGVRPLKSGPQRDAATQRVRAAQKALDEYMRANPHLQPKDPATQMASARTAIVTRLNNLIEDLNAIIEGKESKRPVRAGVPDDPEITALRNEAASLKAYVDDLSGTPDMTPEQWNDRLQNAADRVEAHYRERIRKQQFVDAKTLFEKSQATKDAQAKAREAKEEFEALRESLRPDISQEQAIRQLEGALARRIMELQKAIGAGGTRMPSGRMQSPYSKEISAMKAESALLQTQLRELRGPGGGRVLSAEQRLNNALKAAERSNRMLTARINADEFGAPPKAPGLTSPALESIQAANANLRKYINYVRDISKPRKSQAELALARVTKSLAHVEEHNAKALAGDKTAYATAPKAEREFSGAEAAAIKDARAKLSLARERKQQMMREIELEAEPAWRKFTRQLPRVKKAAVLLNSPIFIKLSIAGNLIRPFTTLLEETIGRAGLRMFMPDVMRSAAGTGGASGIRAFQHYASGMLRGFKEMKHVFATGKTRNQAIYQEGRKIPEPIKPEDYVLGHSHMAIKAPAWEAAFSVSEGNRIAAAGYENAAEVPADQLETMRQAAAKDADHAIYVNSNAAVKTYQAALGVLERNGGPVGAVVSDLLGVENVIVKIPTNLVAEAGKYLFGSVWAPVYRGLLKSKQAGTITPEQADTIARAFKKGGVGLAMLATAIVAPNMIRAGGVYVPGEKRKQGDLQANEVKVFGVKLPHVATHAGAFTGINAVATGVRDYQKQMEDHGGVYSTLHGFTQTLLGLGSGVPFVHGTAEGLASVAPGPQAEAALGRFYKGFVPAPLKVAAEAQDYHGDHGLFYRLTMGQDREDVTQRKGSGPQSAIPRIPFAPWIPNRQDLPER